MERSSEQIQQLYNIDGNQKALQILATDTYENLIKIH